MCSKTALHEVTSNVRKAAEETLGDKLDKVILYGSYARGDYQEDSDIDILILADVPADKIWEARMKIGERTGWLDLEYDVLTSLHVTDSATFYKFAEVLPFYMNVINEGIVVNA